MDFYLELCKTHMIAAKYAFMAAQLDGGDIAATYNNYLASWAHYNSVRGTGNNGD